MKLANIGLLTLILLTGCRQAAPDSAENPDSPAAHSVADAPTDSAGATGWAQDTWNGAVGQGQETVQNTNRWVTQMYTTAKDQGLTSAGNVKDWVANDLKSQGDWQYRIVSMDSTDPPAIQTRLNELGLDRWECFHVADQNGNWTLFLKRPKRSYLSRIPLRDLTNFLPALSGDEPSE